MSNHSHLLDIKGTNLLSLINYRSTWNDAFSVQSPITKRVNKRNQKSNNQLENIGNICHLYQDRDKRSIHWLIAEAIRITEYPVHHANSDPSQSNHHHQKAGTRSPKIMNHFDWQLSYRHIPFIWGWQLVMCGWIKRGNVPEAINHFVSITIWSSPLNKWRRFVHFDVPKGCADYYGFKCFDLADYRFV